MHVLFSMSGLYFMQNLTAIHENNQFDSNLSAKERHNKRYTIYLDLENNKIYQDGNDVTSNFYQPWSADNYNSFIIGHSWRTYNSFIGKLYNLTLLSEPLNESEIQYTSKANNYLFNEKYIMASREKYYYNDYNEDNSLKYIQSINEIIDIENYLFPNLLSLYSPNDNNGVIPLNLIDKLKLLRIEDFDQ